MGTVNTCNILGYVNAKLMLEPSEKGTICTANSNFIASRIIISFTIDISKQ